MVIDFHCHYSTAREPDRSPHETVEMLESNGVDGALIAPIGSLFSSGADCGTENDRIADYCARASGRLFPAISVNPLAEGVALDEIRRCRERYDTRVLKLHPWLQGFSVSSPQMDAVAELCQELCIAILFHDGTPIYSHTLQMARLTRDFPNLTVISGHAGLGDLHREAMLAAMRYPNLVLCLSGPREMVMKEIVKSVPARQLCVGSDLFLSDIDDVSVWFRWTSFRCVEMPEETRRAIEQDTPVRILGLQ